MRIFVGLWAFPGLTFVSRTMVLKLEPASESPGTVLE